MLSYKTNIGTARAQFNVAGCQNPFQQTDLSPVTREQKDLPPTAAEQEAARRQAKKKS